MLDLRLMAGSGEPITHPVPDLSKVQEDLAFSFKTVL